MLTVTRIKNTFDDLLVVNAARVSFGKRHDSFDPVKDSKLIHYLVSHNHWSPLAHPHATVTMYFTKQNTLERLVQANDIMAGLTLVKGDDDNLWHITGSLWALLNLSYFLPNHALFCEIRRRCPESARAFIHTFPSPFKMDDSKTHDIAGFNSNNNNVATFHIKAPIFVARQLVKHQQKLVWNEISRRYVDTTPEFYDPKKMPATLQENSWLVSPDGWENLCGWRGKASNKKQGSSNELVNVLDIDTYMSSLANYEYLIKNGVAPEQARMVLPATMITEWYWSGTKEAFQRVINLRTQPDAQLETAYIATQMHRLLTCR